jgi:hypothetical protein
LLCASEGGLFDYGSDKDILNNLNSLYFHSPEDMRVSGNVIHDINTVDPSIPAMAEVSGAPLRLLGSVGLKNILGKTHWKLDSIQENNPIYAVFLLKK